MDIIVYNIYRIEYRRKIFIKMFLTKSEFDKIRPLQWCLKDFGGKLYNTTLSKTETELFWIDFMRHVFAPKFKQQFGVQSIPNFDQTQPVILTNDLELKLPDLLETAMYYGNNQTLPFSFSIDISHTFVFVVAMIIMFLLLIVAYLVKPSKSNFI